MGLVQTILESGEGSDEGEEHAISESGEGSDNGEEPEWLERGGVVAEEGAQECPPSPLPPSRP